MIGYFTATTIVSYLGVKYVGTRDQLIAGLPVLMWVVLLISGLVILGLYVVLAKSTTSESVAELGDNTEVQND